MSIALWSLGLNSFTEALPPHGLEAVVAPGVGAAKGFEPAKGLAGAAPEVAGAGVGAGKPGKEA